MHTIREKSIYISSLAILLIAACFSVGYYHYDEHFQILEFAAAKIGLVPESELSWEFQNRMRPGLHPLIVTVLWWLTESLGLEPNPFAVATVLRILSGVFAFVTFWCTYVAFRDRFSGSQHRSWFLYLSFLLWFAVFSGVRFSSENWSGLCFVLAFAIFHLRPDAKVGLCIGVGALFGFSFLFRYQAGVLVGGFLLWYVLLGSLSWNRLWSVLLGLTLAIGLGFFADRWLYGEWTLSPWNYLRVNLFEDRVSSFGVSPWYYYLKYVFIQAIPPFSLLFIGGVLYAISAKWRSALAWCLLPFLAIHFSIGHKELRFLFPLIGFLPLATMLLVQDLSERFAKQERVRLCGAFLMKLLIFGNLFLLGIVAMKPADLLVTIYEKIYKRYDEPVHLVSYGGTDIYERVDLQLQFYKRGNLSTEVVKSLEALKAIPSDKTRLLAFSSRNRPAELPENASLVATSFPKWMTQFNFNDWMSRTTLWYVYEW